MITRERFALNRIMCPSLSIMEFISLAETCRLSNIELRNDLADRRITGSISPSETSKVLKDSGVTVATINAVQKFNLPSSYSIAEEEIKRMAEICAVIGCKGIILCPNNDINDKRSGKQFIEDTARGLSLYAPLFRQAGIKGLVEPLGFGECSIRGKKAAIEAIKLCGEEETYSVVHDTFHHYLGTDNQYYPENTGFMHISGVEANVADSSMRDCHRVMVTSRDRIGNKKQIQEIDRQGYRGIVSFEPFSEEIQKLDKKSLAAAINESIGYIINE